MEIIGYGGKGGEARAPVESPDSLQSKAIARVIDLISEGEIEGLVAGARSVFFDDTPLMDDDGNFNFKGVSFETRAGTQIQSYIQNFSDIENSVSVGVRVKFGQPFIRRIDNQNVNKVRLTVGIPGLSQTNTKNGDITGTSVDLRLSVSSDGGPYVPLYSTIGARNFSPLQLSGVLFASAQVRFTWKRPSEAVNTTYSFRDDGTSNGNVVSLNRSQSRPAFARVVISAYRNGSLTPTKTETQNLTGLSDGSTSVHVASFGGVVPVGQYTFTVEIQSGEGTVELLDIPGTELISTTHTIKGKSSSRYQRSFLIPLSGTGPWDIKVERLTADSTSQALNNQTFVDLISEIIEAKPRYPNSALVALEVDASQFSSIPVRAYDVKLLKIKIPVNYDPIARTYSGSWDGTFKTAWSDNPAWCFYDMVTNERYGLGGFVPASQVDKWMLYKIAQYCDGLVPDGKGGVEPRLTCNLYLGNRNEAYKVINDMASIFRGIVYWSSGSITAVQDAPQNPSLIYSAANVIDGVFSYSGSSAKARHTVALVTWNDPADGYKQKVEYVEDQFGVARLGIVQTEVIAVGCTSQGQARRLGQWMLIAERAESEVVSFKIGLDGAIARPGDIIKVADPARSGVRYGGRLKSATSTVLSLDSAITLTAGQQYTISVIGSDGKVIERTHISNGVSGQTLTLPAPLPETPVAGSMWVLSTLAVSAQLFRVISVAEDERNEFSITALAYEPAKYDALEYGTQIQPRSTSVITSVPVAPTNLTASESLYLSPDGVKNRLILSWMPVQFATSYVITYQVADGNKSPEIITNLPSVDIADVITGTQYTFTVLAVNALNLRGQQAVLSYSPVGKSFPPSNVNNFRVSRIVETIRFTWNHITDIDLDYYEIRQGSVWVAGVTVAETAGNMIDVLSPRGGTFMIRAVDTSGSYSQTEAVVIVADYTNVNAVVRYDDGFFGFPGLTEGTAVLSNKANFQWADEISWDDFLSWNQQKNSGGVTVCGTTPWSAYMASWSSYTTPWLFLEDASTGKYTTNPVDIGYVASASVSLDARVSAITRDNPPWSTFTQPWAYYSLPEFTWVKSSDAYSVSFEISTSVDGLSYTPWQAFTPGAFTFRYLKIRATLATSDISFLPFMEKLLISVDVPDRVDHYNDIPVSVAGVTLNFNPDFIAVQTVQVTLQDASIGDNFVVTGKSPSAVSVRIYDSTGTPKAGVADIDVFGYGEKA